MRRGRCVEDSVSQVVLRRSREVDKMTKLARRDTSATLWRSTHVSKHTIQMALKKPMHVGSDGTKTEELNR